jgi:hypothetical protein
MKRKRFSVEQIVAVLEQAEIGEHIWTHPVCKGLADSGVGKRRMHISGLSMEEVSPSGP